MTGPNPATAWSPTSLSSTDRPTVNGTRRPAPAAGGRAGTDYSVVAEMRARVATRLAAEEQKLGRLSPGDRRELIRSLVHDELNQWVLHQVEHGRPAPAIQTEDELVDAVLAELNGLGRLTQLLSRTDVEDIHFEGTDPTVLRLSNGTMVPGPPIASSDAELVQLIQSIGARFGDGHTSREFSPASPVMNVRLRDVGELGARLAAEMDVVQRVMGTIRIHRFVKVALEDLRRMRMIDDALHAFLKAAVLAGASMCVTGAPAVGKTTLLRALVAEIPPDNVLVTVEDDRELGTHLLGRHAVVKSYEERLPNAEGMGGFTMGDALNQALRDSPTRIVVGEVRGGYVVHLLDAVTNGIAGAMCTLHTPTARGVFERVLINAQKAIPTPSAELVMRSLSALDLIVHVERNNSNDRYVSEVLELGRVGDNGDPDATSVFAPGSERRAVGVPGSLSPDLQARLTTVGFNIDWLRPEHATWFRAESAP